MPDYDFRSLSPIDFEALVRDLLNADLGTKFTSFAVGPDGGIDLRDASKEKPLIAQCKHRPDAKKRALVTSAAAEAGRWQSDQLDKYYFVVSAPLTPRGADEVKAALSPLPVDSNPVWHQGSLNAAISRHPQIEKDHFKLWLSSAVALERIIQAAQWQRSEELLQRVSERVRLYVHTPAYSRSMKILQEEHVVIISGAPGVGKSTLAEMILLTLWNEGWTVANIADDVNDAWSRFFSDDDKVVFYYDDFLGQTSTAELQKNEASGILLLMNRIRASKGNKLLILTSREQILGEVLSGNDDRARRIVSTESKVRLELDEISRSAKAEMLFNHLHFGFADPASRSELANDKRYRIVIDHKGFNPRVLESLVLQQKHLSVDEFYKSLLHALEHPEDIWAGSFQQLSRTAVKILMQLAVWPKPFMPLDRLRAAVAIEDPREWNSALKVLENTWIRLGSGSRISQKGRVDSISLFDPSRRDYLLDLIDNPAYFDSIFNNLCSILQLSFLLRSSGVIDHNRFGAETLREPISEHVNRKFESIDYIARRLAAADIQMALSFERQIVLEKTKKVRSPNFEWVDFYQPLTGRMEVLLELAKICFSFEAPTPSVEIYLDEQLGDFVEAISTENNLESEPLLKLVGIIATNPDSECFKRHAVKLVDTALDNMSKIEDLEAYFDLPSWMRDGLLNELAEERLDFAFEQELDGIRQQNDPDLMEQWLDQIQNLANKQGFSISWEDVYEEIEELRSRYNNGRSPLSQMRPSTPMPDASNDSIDLIFRKLL